MLCHLAGVRDGRRGDHLADLVRRHGELLHLRGRTPGLRRRRPADAQPRPGGRRGRDHRAHEGRSSPSTCSATRASSTSCARSPSATGCWIIDDSCEALGAEYKGRPIGSHGISGAFGFYPNKQITTGEGGDRHDALRGGVGAPEEPAQPGPLVRVALVPPRAARVQLPLHRPAGGGRDRAAREARRDPATARRGSGPLRRAARGRGRRRAAASPTTPTTCGRGSSTCRSWRRASTARRSSPRLADEGIEAGALRPVRPPPAVHARALRLHRRRVPGRRGRERPDAWRSRSSPDRGRRTRSASSRALRARRWRPSSVDRRVDAASSARTASAAALRSGDPRRPRCGRSSAGLSGA